MTPQQRRTRDFIHDFWEDKGYAPSYREIQAELGLKSVSGVARLIKALVERGYVRVVPNTKRSVEAIAIKEKQGR